MSIDKTIHATRILFNSSNSPNRMSTAYRSPHTQNTELHIQINAQQRALYITHLFDILVRRMYETRANCQ